MNALESADQKFVQNAKHNAAVLKECREKTKINFRNLVNNKKKCPKNCLICESKLYNDCLPL
jgi:hypothetical protein